ncbi:hypothetical protein LPW26_02385 [Rhodopseudomonas sp. HC1]|uniref:hypothetical protein n=1 Tax=Rhodopseudomonas infernalis TaxID=2897386 RepID=UPI001EE934F3|nr:hypothetical protein [Rhodopseudomonas infernalis]MCG6203475.1 hypothetical protein [Rhodopseudomonas infernalis]
MQPRPPRHPKSLYQRLIEEALSLRDQAENAPSDARDRLLSRAQQLESAANMEGWLSSAELKPPT